MIRRMEVQGGIWMSGEGPAADSSGNIFFAIGNGSFNANSATAPNRDYGDKHCENLALPAGGTFSSSRLFPIVRGTTSARRTLTSTRGSGGVLLLPTAGTKNNLIQAGKDGRIYVTDQTALGGFNATLNSVVQEVSGQLKRRNVGARPYTGTGNIYFGRGSGRRHYR